MIFIVDRQTDPYLNLAAEEYLLHSFAEPVFRLWRNAPCVVIGKNQNALAEIDIDYVRQHGIAVVRRLTGGGAVFHDLGNVNFSFFDAHRPEEGTGDMFRRFTAPILSALQNLGIDARLQGRNDLTIDGRKFSGNALCVVGGRVLQHGTLLFDTSMKSLAGALRNRSIKYCDKAVKSNVSRVTNISSHLNKTMGCEDFIAYLGDFIGKDLTRYDYSEADRQAIEALARDKYALDSWNFAASPRYNFNNSAKLACGLIEVSFDVEAGRISSLSINGDFFFTRPVEEFCSGLLGCEHLKEKVAGAIAKLSPGDYFGPVSAEELTDLFF